MAFAMRDRVRVTSTSTGSGDMTGLTTVPGYQSFAFAAPADSVPYSIVCADTGEWEVGLGTYAASTLTRVAILSSSNSNLRVTFGAGTKDIFCTLPAVLAMTTYGGAFTSPITVPAGAASTQVPQAQEVGALTVAQRADVYRRGNVRGALSMSGSTPTGALLDSGGGIGNGWARYACGTQICWLTSFSVTNLTGSLGSIYLAGPFTDSFPVTFITTPVISITAIESSVHPCWASCGTPNLTGVANTFLFAPAAGASCRYQIMAIGRWAS